MYYSFTSLSTVGFGDFHPVNNFERMFCAYILLVGNAIFGYVLGMFREMVQEVKGLDSDGNDHADDLNKFFSLLSHYNEGRPFNANLKRKIEAYFEYRWKNDKDFALGVNNEADKEMLEQLPEVVQIKIYKFLFSGFLNKFRTFFTFFKHQEDNDDSNNILCQKSIRLDLYTW